MTPPQTANQGREDPGLWFRSRRYGRKTLGLKESELARLVASLRGLQDPSADAVAEEIGALKLAGVRVDLRLNTAETGAPVSSITRVITRAPGPQGRFNQLLSLARAAEEAWSK